MLSRKPSVFLVGSALVMLALCGTAFASYQAELDEAKAKAALENKPVLIDFYTDW